MRNALLVLFGFCLFFFILPEKKMAAESLQALLDAAKEGAVIKLDNQTYEGDIVIRKSITLIGGKHTIIKGDGNGNVVSIKADHVRLSQLTVEHSSMNRNSAEEYAAIKVYSNQNIIEFVKIRDSFHGIYLSKAHHNIVRNNKITGLGKNEIAAQGNGLHIYYATDNLLENNTIEGTRDGMFFYYASHNEINENSISKTRYGLHYMYSDSNTFIKNTFMMNTGGAAIMNSNQLTLEDNQFIFNYGNQSFGLLLLQANDNHIENNTFYMNQRGLYLDQATNNEILNNKLIQNQIGIELLGSSNQQTFSLNRITDNTIPAVSLGGAGKGNSWSENGRGNDWGSTFPLTDLDQNGVGDFPITYRSSLHQLMKDQELTTFFLKSPALTIFEKINTLLNQDEVMFTDPHPLVSHQNHHLLRWLLLVTSAILGLLILRKRRQLLCIIFGKNGRKI